MYDTDRWSEYQGYDPKGESIEDIVKRMTAQQKMIASTIQEIKDMGTEIQYNRSQITQTAESIKQEVYQRIEGMEGAWQGEYTSLVEQTAKEIRSQLDAKISDYDVGITGRYRSEISQTANSIRSEVSIVEQALDGRIAAANSRITQTATEIRSEVKTTETNLNNKITANTSSITQTSKDINLRVDGVVTSVTGIDTRLSSAELKITDNAIVSTVRSSTGYKNDLNAKANNSTVNDLGTRLITAESNITQTSDKINLRVDQVEINVSDINKRLSSAELKITNDAIVSTVTSSNAYKNDLNGKVNTTTFNSEVTQLSNSISQKVSSTDFNGNTVASLINQTATTIKMSALKIDLDGIVNVASTLQIGSINNTGTKTIRFNGQNVISDRSVGGNTWLLALSAERMEINTPYLDLSPIGSINWGRNAPTARWG